MKKRPYSRKEAQDTSVLPDRPQEAESPSKTEVEPRNGLIRAIVVAVISGLLVAALVGFWHSMSSLETNIEGLSRRLSYIEGQLSVLIENPPDDALDAVQELRKESVILRDIFKTGETAPPIEGNQEIPFVSGKVISPEGVAIPDAEIQVWGGSKKHSNSNGEFYIYARSGDTISIARSGYESVNFNVLPSQIRQKGLTFTLRKER